MHSGVSHDAGAARGDGLHLPADAWFQQAYTTLLWPVLGFIFMPYLTLAYMVMKLQGGTLAGAWLVLVVVAAVIDVIHWGGTGHHYRRWRD